MLAPACLIFLQLFAHTGGVGGSLTHWQDYQGSRDPQVLAKTIASDMLAFFQDQPGRPLESNLAVAKSVRVYLDSFYESSKWKSELLENPDTETLSIHYAFILALSLEEIQKGSRAFHERKGTFIYEIAVTGLVSHLLTHMAGVLSLPPSITNPVFPRYEGILVPHIFLRDLKPQSSPLTLVIASLTAFYMGVTLDPIGTTVGLGLTLGSAAFARRPHSLVSRATASNWNAVRWFLQAINIIHTKTEATLASSTLAMEHNVLMALLKRCVGKRRSL